MTNQEAVTMVEVMRQADGQCNICALNLAEEAAKVLPEHPWVALMEYAMWDDDNGDHPLPDGYPAPKARW